MLQFVISQIFIFHQIKLLKALNKKAFIYLLTGCNEMLLLLFYLILFFGKA